MRQNVILKLTILKYFVIPVFFVTFSSTLFGQKAVKYTLKTNNGSVVNLYDDNTWEYKNATGQKTVSQQYNIIGSGKTTSTKTRTASKKSSYQSSSSYSSTCGARNKTGGYCKRTVRGGGRCWQH